MAKVTYIEFDGTEHHIDIPPGQSVMDGAVRNAIPGIEADCSGSCACATCHVYVDDAWIGQFAAPSDMEQAMLDHSVAPRTNSRLSCQLTVTEALDGLIVRLPETQYH